MGLQAWRACFAATGSSHCGSAQPSQDYLLRGRQCLHGYFWGKLVQQILAEDQARHGHGDSGKVAGFGSRSIDNLVGSVGELCGAEKCLSVLVETGVFSADGAHPVTLEHSPRDFLPVENSYQEPVFTTPHVLAAVQTIFEKEQWSVYKYVV